jgi:hypothetical protein
MAVGAQVLEKSDQLILFIERAPLQERQNDFPVGTTGPTSNADSLRISFGCCSQFFGKPMNKIASNVIIIRVSHPFNAGERNFILLSLPFLFPLRPVYLPTNLNASRWREPL